MKHATKMAPAKEIYFGILPASPLVQKSLGDPYHMLVRVQVELKLTSYGRVSQSCWGNLSLCILCKNETLMCSVRYSTVIIQCMYGVQ